MSRKKTGAITSMSLLLIMMTVVLAFQPLGSAAAEKQQDIHTRVFITKPLCTNESAWELRQGIMLNKYGYAPYTNSSLEVSCFPHVSLLTLDRTVENLRIMYPDDMFVFVYDLSSTADKKAGSLISDRWEWNLWLKTYSTVPSTFDYSLLLGKAWIDKGYAIADHNSEVINHEWAHLETCKIHGPHTDEGNPATWQPFFSKNETRPWCAG